MFQSLQTLVESTVMERITLLVNHVISAEPAAVERLRRHSGSSVQVEAIRWPTMLPPLPAIAFRVTPAGLVEWLPEAGLATAELRIEVDAANPARALANLLTGTKPEVSVAGNAAFAADVDWLIANLRWDLEDDLARIVGIGPAHQIARLARAAAEGVRKVARTVGGVVTRDAASAPVRPTPR